MKRIILIATPLFLLIPTLARAVPFHPVSGSTVSLSCTQTALAATLINTKGPQIKISSLGTNKVFIKFGDSTVVAGTSNSVVLPSSYLLYTRNLNSETHVSCICAATETATVYVETGYGE